MVVSRTLADPKVERLQARTCRAQGPSELLYITVQEYLEVNARPWSEHLYLSSEEMERLNA